MKYVLFKKTPVEAAEQSFSMFSMISGFTLPGDEWKSEDSKCKEKKETIHFVAIVDSPKELASIVRKSPTEKYLLFYGEVQEMTVAIPIFIGGKNLATLDSEWGENE